MVSIFLKTDFVKNTWGNCSWCGSRFPSFERSWNDRRKADDRKRYICFIIISSSYRNSRVLINWLPVLCQFLCDVWNDYTFGFCCALYTFQFGCVTLEFNFINFPSGFLVFLRDLHNIYFKKFVHFFLLFYYFYFCYSLNLIYPLCKYSV